MEEEAGEGGTLPLASSLHDKLPLVISPLDRDFPLNRRLFHNHPLFQGFPHPRGEQQFIEAELTQACSRDEQGGEVQVGHFSSWSLSSRWNIC